MERLATGWLAWELTGSAAWLGVIAFMRLIPALVFGLVGGAWADRVSAMRVLRVTNLGIIAANSAMLALLLSGTLTIYGLAVMALLVGALQALSNPAGSAFVYELVPRALVGRAISISALTFHVATFTGPALAGVLIAGGGAAAIYALAAAGQAIMLVVLLSIPSPPAPPAPKPGGHRPSLLADVVSGLRYVRGDRPIYALLVVHFIFALSAHPLVDMMPAIATLFYGGGAEQVGALTAALGAPCWAAC
jgi:MFS family permease